MTPPPFDSASQSWSGGFPRSSEARAEAARIAARLAEGGVGAEAFRGAVMRRLLREDAALLHGIAQYRRHPHRRTLEDPPVIWREGASRLLDYRPEGGRPILVVPSLVNRAQVLDLDEGASLMRFLAGQGLRPLLLDWGWPEAEERGMTLTDLIAGRLERAMAAVPGEMVLLGYCMGGLLALAAALRRPERVSGLALLATPWDFHADPEAPDLARLLPGLEAMMAPMGALPVDAIQSLFALLDPFGLARKFRAFGRLDMAGARARRFVVLEDWLNDGVPLPAPVARECIADWYGANLPGRGDWRVAGWKVRPEEWRGPAFVAIPSRDRIVLPASARALAAALPTPHVLDAAAGHIGMVAGEGAERVLWRPLLEWLRDA